DPHAQAVRRDERLAGLRCLAAEHPIGLRRVAARFVGGDAGHLGAGHEVHLPLRGLLPLREGPMHRPGLFDHPVAEAPGGDAFPPAGPPVVPAGLFVFRREAFAILIASSTIARTPSFDNEFVAANPSAPFTKTRTPMPWSWPTYSASNTPFLRMKFSGSCFSYRASA